MSPAGLVLIGVGAWVIAQVFAGDALRRLNITPNATNPRSVDGQKPADDSAAGAAGRGALLGPGGAVWDWATGR